MRQLKHFQDHHRIRMDDPTNLHRCIDYRGSGWYSLDTRGIYRAGSFATYSRIEILDGPAWIFPYKAA